jgi:putative transposase
MTVGPAENSHQPTRERERRIPRGDFLRGTLGFRDPKRTRKFLSCSGPFRQYFALKRRLLRASLYRKQLAARFIAWRESTQNPPIAF